MAFTLPELGYSYADMEPHIDARTMEIHHSKHHAGYTNNLNAAIAGTALANQSIEDILRNVSQHSAAVRNNGGGYYNHRLFWEILSPRDSKYPDGMAKELIDVHFGSYSEFKQQFANAAATRFGSGWAWLCKKDDGSLEICSTPNQDNPLMDVESAGCGGTPVLGLDVWEHAYYLNYQNRRADYIEAFFNIINWHRVNELLI